jgi:hypothetical protein
MRSKLCELTIPLVLFLASLNGLAQSPSQRQSLSDTNVRSQPRMLSLLARSELQRPKPLPVVRPLRFEEIPVGAETPRLGDTSIHFDSTAEVEENPSNKAQSQVLPVQSDGAR